MKEVAVMVARSTTLLVLIALVAAAAAGAGPAGKPGSWTRVTDKNGSNTNQVGLARTGDGTLHVLWARRTGKETSILHTPVAPSGAVGSAGNVAGGFRAVGDPDVVVMPDGSLRTFFMGLGASIEEGGVRSAAAPASGVGWALEGTRVSSSWHAVGPVGATVAGDGNPAFAYGMSFVLGLHFGLDPGDEDTNLAPDKRCCDYLPDLATDAQSKATYIAWYSNADARHGVWAQRVAPMGARQRAPGSAKGDKSIGQDVRTAIAARIGAPGVYVAYCSGYPRCKSVLVWRPGGGVLNAGGSPDVEDVAISAAPQGRLWVMWHDGQNEPRILARRSNKAATRFGPLVEVKPPPQTRSIWKLSGEGSLGPLDLMASVSTPGSLATWHTQVLPPLTLGAAVNQKTNTVTFTVVDAGDAVAGAKVSVAGKTLTTNAAGHASATLAPGSYSASASMEDYASDKATFRIEEEKK